MTKNFTQILHGYAREFNKPFVEGIRESINKIKERYGMTDEDLSLLLDDDVTKLTDETYDPIDVNTDAIIDLRTISILTLLWPNLHVLTDTPSGKMCNDVNTLVKEYMDEKHPQPKQVSDTWYDKVKDILNMFGVTNDDDLDRLREAVSKVRGIIETYDESHPETKENKIPNKMCGGDKKGELYFDDNGNFSTQKPRILNDNTCHCKKDCVENNTNTNDNGTVKGVFYDSENMDKPKEFEFKTNLAKDFPTLFKFFTDILK